MPNLCDISFQLYFDVKLQIFKMIMLRIFNKSTLKKIIVLVRRVPFCGKYLNIENKFVLHFWNNQQITLTLLIISLINIVIASIGVIDFVLSSNSETQIFAEI